MNKIPFALILGAALLTYTACGTKSNPKTEQQASASTKAPIVKVEKVHAEDVDVTNTYTSNIEPNVTNNIVSQSSGRIKNIYVEVGNKVRKGQLLAEMDAINLMKTKLQLKNDSIELGRLTELKEVGGVAQADYDLAKLSYDLTKKTYENLLENTKLTSPINGVVTARNYDKDDMYSMAQPIFVVEQISPVKMVINVSESYFTLVHNGMEFEVVTESYPNEVFKGKVNLIYPTVNANTHTFPVEIIVPNADQKLRPGMFARVTANFGSNHSVVVPDVAVVKQVGSGEHFIYVLNADSTVTYKKVEIGKRLGNKYEILSGIEDGAVVVSEGQVRLKDGIKVSAQN